MGTIFGGPECLLGCLAIFEVFQLGPEQLFIAFHHNDIVGRMVFGERRIGEVVGEGPNVFVFKDGV
ncbi:hypothetical protein D3C78_1619460 [compost metagenome]